MSAVNLQRFHVMYVLNISMYPCMYYVLTYPGYYGMKVHVLKAVCSRIYFSENMKFRMHVNEEI